MPGSLHGMQGVIGLSTQATGWLAFHVALGGAACAALAAHDAANYSLLDLK